MNMLIKSHQPYCPKQETEKSTLLTVHQPGNLIKIVIFFKPKINSIICD